MRAFGPTNTRARPISSAPWSCHGSDHRSIAATSHLCLASNHFRTGGSRAMQSPAFGPTSLRASSGLLDRFRVVRAASLALTAPLSPEDLMVQSCAEASPAKWHLAHTTWFFETFVLRDFL